MKFYTTKDLADMFNVSTATIRREIERKKLRCFYVGNEARFTEQQVRDYAHIIDDGKTEHEVRLEETIQELQQMITEKEEVIRGIKEFLLRQA